MSRPSKISVRETILLFERIEMYVLAGTPIDQALKTSAEGAPKKHRAALDAISREVESGIRVSAAFREHIRISDVVFSLISCGEMAGELALGFSASRRILERQDELKKKCLSAITYPVVIGLVAVTLTVGLMRYVMPEITPMLLGLRMDLPMLTRIVMFASESLVSYGFYGAIGLVVLCAGFISANKWSRRFRYWVHAALGRVPLLGRLVETYSLSIFLSSCGSLIDSGKPVSQAAEEAVAVISHLPLQDKLKREMGEVSRGVSLGEILGRVDIPSYMVSLAVAGERSGLLGKSLERAAEIADKGMDHTLRRLTSLIEPVMMAGMGGAIGAVAVSIMLPIYDVSKVLQQ